MLRAEGEKIHLSLSLSLSFSHVCVCVCVCVCMCVCVCVCVPGAFVVFPGVRGGVSLETRSHARDPTGIVHHLLGAYCTSSEYGYFTELRIKDHTIGLESLSKILDASKDVRAMNVHFATLKGSSLICVT